MGDTSHGEHAGPGARICKREDRLHGARCPGPEAGGERGTSSRNSGPLPGHAGHSSGLRLPHRRSRRFTMEEGVISPGGVGYDINCGVRLIGSDLTKADIHGRLHGLADALFRDVPSGVGSHGAISRLSDKQLDRLLVRGAAWVVENGYGEALDLEKTEEGGAIGGADPEAVSN